MSPEPMNMQADIWDRFIMMTLLSESKTGVTFDIKFIDPIGLDKTSNKGTSK